MTAGPTPLPPAVSQVKAEPMLYHRAPAFIEGYARESVINFVGSACFLRVHPTASAAGNAPTGWLLSDDAESGLAQSIQAPSPTYEDVERLVRWMDGTGTNADCTP